MSSIVLTDVGNALLTDIIAGIRTATFKEIQLSSHNYSGTLLSSLTALTEVKQTESFTSVDVVDSSTIKLYAFADNETISTTFTINTIGIIATDSNNVDILYAVIDMSDAPDTQPGYNGHNLNRLSYDFILNVGSASSVSINVTAVTSADQIEYDSNKNVKQKIQEVETTANNAMTFKGDWNANTNTPTLSNGTGAEGDEYRVSVAGTFNDVYYSVFDQIVYHNGIWSRVNKNSITDYISTQIDNAIVGAIGGSY